MLNKKKEEAGRRVEINESGVPVAFEDRFLIIGVGPAKKMAPGTRIAEILATIFTSAREKLSTTLVLDLRGLKHFYSDIVDFIECLVTEPHLAISSSNKQAAKNKYHFLISADDKDILSLLDTTKASPYIIKSKGSPPLNQRLYDLEWIRSITKDYSNRFVEDASILLHLVATNWQSSKQDLGKRLLDMTSEEIKNCLKTSDVLSVLEKWIPNDVSLHRNLEGVTYEFQKVFSNVFCVMKALKEKFRIIADYDEFYEVESIGRILCYAHFLTFLKSIERKSLLIEFSMQAQPDRILCVPYHSFAIHNIEHPKKDDILVGRPGVFASRTLAVFNREIREFQELINKPGVKEKELQKFLENNSNFLRGLNYQNIYPQLVLEREEKGSLRPDFILEPFKGDWCDILEVKLPKPDVVIGSKDRDVLAAALHQVAAQLREYAAYFENPKYRKWFYQKYGLKCYRPRLIALVGRDMLKMSEVEIRRAMTCYADLDVVTFDKLLKIAKNRLLI